MQVPNRKLAFPPFHDLSAPALRALQLVLSETGKESLELFSGHQLLINALLPPIFLRML